MSKNKGFTLIELLVVIAIMGFLTAITLVAMNGPKIKARDTAKIRELQEVRSALQMFYADNGCYPNGNHTTLGNYLSGTLPSKWPKIYIPSIPKSIVYSGVINNNLYAGRLGECQSTSYRLGVALEDRKNKLLISDVNDYLVLGLSNSFNGRTDTCIIGSANITGTNLCYAVKP